MPFAGFFSAQNKISNTGLQYKPPKNDISYNGPGFMTGWWSDNRTTISQEYPDKFTAFFNSSGVYDLVNVTQDYSGMLSWFFTVFYQCECNWDSLHSDIRNKSNEDNEKSSKHVYEYYISGTSGNRVISTKASKHLVRFYYNSLQQPHTNQNNLSKVHYPNGNIPENVTVTNNLNNKFLWNGDSGIDSRIKVYNDPCREIIRGSIGITSDEKLAFYSMLFHMQNSWEFGFRKFTTGVNGSKNYFYKSEYNPQVIYASNVKNLNFNTTSNIQDNYDAHVGPFVMCRYQHQCPADNIYGITADEYVNLYYNITGKSPFHYALRVDCIPGYISDEYHGNIGSMYDVLVVKVKHLNNVRNIYFYENRGHYYLPGIGQFSAALSKPTSGDDIIYLTPYNIKSENHNRLPKLSELEKCIGLHFSLNLGNVNVEELGHSNEAHHWGAGFTRVNVPGSHGTFYVPHYGEDGWRQIYNSLVEGNNYKRPFFYGTVPHTHMKPYTVKPVGENGKKFHKYYWGDIEPQFYNKVINVPGGSVFETLPNANFINSDNTSWPANDYNYNGHTVTGGPLRSRHSLTYDIAPYYDPYIHTPYVTNSYYDSAKEFWQWVEVNILNIFKNNNNYISLTSCFYLPLPQREDRIIILSPLTFNANSIILYSPGYNYTNHMQGQGGIIPSHDIANRETRTLTLFKKSSYSNYPRETFISFMDPGHIYSFNGFFNSAFSDSTFSSFTQPNDKVSVESPPSIFSRSSFRTDQPEFIDVINPNQPHNGDNIYYGNSYLSTKFTHLFTKHTRWMYVQSDLAYNNNSNNGSHTYDFLFGKLINMNVYNPSVYYDYRHEFGYTDIGLHCHIYAEGNAYAGEPVFSFLIRNDRFFENYDWHSTKGDVTFNGDWNSNMGNGMYILRVIIDYGENTNNTPKRITIAKNKVNIFPPRRKEDWDIMYKDIESAFNYDTSRDFNNKNWTLRLENQRTYFNTHIMTAKKVLGWDETNLEEVCSKISISKPVFNSNLNRYKLLDDKFLNENRGIWVAYKYRNLFVSTDNGETFYEPNHSLNPKVFAGNITCAAYGNGKWIIGTDGGVVKYTTSNKTFPAETSEKVDAGTTYPSDNNTIQKGVYVWTKSIAGGWKADGTWAHTNPGHYVNDDSKNTAFFFNWSSEPWGRRWNPHPYWGYLETTRNQNLKEVYAVKFIPELNNGHGRWFMGGAINIWSRYLSPICFSNDNGYSWTTAVKREDGNFTRAYYNDDHNQLYNRACLRYFGYSEEPQGNPEEHTTYETWWWFFKTAKERHKDALAPTTWDEDDRLRVIDQIIKAKDDGEEYKYIFDNYETGWMNDFIVTDFEYTKHGYKDFVIIAIGHSRATNNTSRAAVSRDGGMTWKQFHGTGGYPVNGYPNFITSIGVYDYGGKIIIASKTHDYYNSTTESTWDKAGLYSYNDTVSHQNFWTNLNPDYSIFIKNAEQSYGAPITNIIDIGTRVIIFTTGNLTFFRNASNMQHKIYGLPIYSIDYSYTDEPRVVYLNALFYINSATDGVLNTTFNTPANHINNVKYFSPGSIESDNVNFPESTSNYNLRHIKSASFDGKRIIALAASSWGTLRIISDDFGESWFSKVINFDMDKITHQYENPGWEPILHNSRSRVSGSRDFRYAFKNLYNWNNGYNSGVGNLLNWDLRCIDKSFNMENMFENCYDMNIFFPKKTDFAIKCKKMFINCRLYNNGETIGKRTKMNKYNFNFIQDASEMFKNCSSFNGDFTGCKFSDCIDLTDFLYGAISFNSDITDVLNSIYLPYSLPYTGDHKDWWGRYACNYNREPHRGYGNSYSYNRNDNMDTMLVKINGILTNTNLDEENLSKFIIALYYNRRKFKFNTSDIYFNTTAKYSPWLQPIINKFGNSQYFNIECFKNIDSYTGGPSDETSASSSMQQYILSKFDHPFINDDGSELYII